MAISIAGEIVLSVKYVCFNIKLDDVERLDDTEKPRKIIGGMGAISKLLCTNGSRRKRNNYYFTELAYFN